jgi:hypothetical protein
MTGGKTRGLLSGVLADVYVLDIESQRRIFCLRKFLDLQVLHCTRVLVQGGVRQGRKRMRRDKRGTEVTRSTPAVGQGEGSRRGCC